jgi:Mg2+ and Co2+ transporter CorA
LVLKKSIQVIQLAIDKYAHHVENDIQAYEKDLNSVLKVFTFLTITVLPQTVVGGMFGMNITVPMQSAVS